VPAYGGRARQAARLTRNDGGFDLILLPLGTSVQDSVGEFLPMIIAENSITAVKPAVGNLAPGAGFAMLCLYAVAALVAGGWVLARRDA
jgi:hypothetical protein